MTAPGADASGRTAAGSAYVIFGKSDTTDVDLANLGTQGYRIQGDAGSRVTNASAIGDVDGDGIPDILLGGHGAWQLYAKATTTTVDLASTFSGYTMTAPSGSSYDVATVSSANDIDGNGSPDALVTFPNAANGLGDTFTVFDQTTNSTVALATLPGDKGFEVTGTGRFTSGSSGADGGAAGAAALPLSQPGVGTGQTRMLNSTPFEITYPPGGINAAPRAICWRSPTVPYPLGYFSSATPLPQCRIGTHHFLDIPYAGGSTKSRYSIDYHAYAQGNARVVAPAFPAGATTQGVYDSLGNPIFILRQNFGGCYDIYSVDLQYQTSTTRAGVCGSGLTSHGSAYLELSGNGCMVPGRQNEFWLFSIKAQPFKNVRGVEIHGFISKGAFPSISMNDPRLVGATPGYGPVALRDCQAVPYREKGVTPVNSAVSAATFASGDVYVNARSCSAPYYAGTTCAQHSNDDPYNNYRTTGLGLNLSYMVISTPAVSGAKYNYGGGYGQSGIVSAVFKVGTASQTFSTFGYSDPNVPCGHAASARWSYLRIGAIHGWMIDNVPGATHNCS